MALAFLDEVGNPFPAGISVSVYPSPGPQTPATLIATDFTIAGGTCPDIEVAQAVSYIATFYGNRGPTSAQTFAGDVVDPTVVTVLGYRSPSLSQEGYTVEETLIWPRGPGWFGEDARQPGSNAWATAWMIASLLALFDLEAQILIESERIQSAVGSEINAWALDFLNGFFPQFIGESYTSYKGRVIALLSGEKCTVAGIQEIVDSFYTAIEDELAQSYAGNITYDGQGGYDSQGGYDVANPFNPADALPTVLVWDRQKRPDLADIYNVNPDNDNGDFVIQIGFNPLFPGAWYLDHSHLDSETFLIDSTTFDLSDVAPDPRLAALVDLVMAAGTHPLYLTYIANA